jgi:hypothetical protein
MSASATFAFEASIMKATYAAPAIVALALAAASQAPAGDWSQLVASAGLTPAEAAGMTLTELHAHKINRESAADDAVTVSSRSYPAFDVAAHRQLVAVAGLRPSEAYSKTLTEIAARKVNLVAEGDERIPVVARGTGFDATDHPQLLAAAGLAPAEAAGMSLAELHARKINREQGRDGEIALSD